MNIKKVGTSQTESQSAINEHIGKAGDRKFVRHKEKPIELKWPSQFNQKQMRDKTSSRV